MNTRILAPILLALSLAAPGCGEEAPDVSERQLPRSQAQHVRPEAKPVPKSLANLDAFGNLIAAKERIYGFELPLGVRDKRATSVSTSLYIPTTDARLRRFYRSRGYIMEQGPRGYSARHSPRTLAKIEPAYHPAAKRASLHVSQGPGPGFTIRIDSNEAIALAQPPLAKLVGPREEPEPPKLPGAPGAEGEGEGQAEQPRRRKLQTKQLSKFERSRLRKQALEKRKLAPGLRDVSGRIVEWSESTGQPFLD